VDVFVDHLVGAPYESLRAGAVGFALGPLVKLKNKTTKQHESQRGSVTNINTHASANVDLGVIGQEEPQEEDVGKGDKITTI